MPELLRQACLQAVKALYDAREDDGVSSVTTGGPTSQTTTYLDRALPTQTVEILRHFRPRRYV
jgi:hypothetical protein